MQTTLVTKDGRGIPQMFRTTNHFNIFVNRLKKKFTTDVFQGTVSLFPYRDR